VLMTLISSAVMLGVIFGVIYWQSYDKEKQFVILDIQMCVVMVTAMSVFLPYDVTLTFPKERKIFLRERKAGSYSTSCFYFARILADMPMHMLAGAVFALIIYPMAGLKMGAHIFAALTIMAILVGASVMQLIGAISQTFEEANILMMLVTMMTMMLSSGFVREVPIFLEWAREISLMGLLADIGLYLEFRDVDASFGTPSQVWASFGARITSEDEMSSALWILFATYVFCRIVTYLAVKFLYTGRSFAENLKD